MCMGNVVESLIWTKNGEHNLSIMSGEWIIFVQLTAFSIMPINKEVVE